MFKLASGLFTVAHQRLSNYWLYTACWGLTVISNDIIPIPIHICCMCLPFFQRPDLLLQISCCNSLATWHKFAKSMASSCMKIFLQISWCRVISSILGRCRGGGRCWGRWGRHGMHQARTSERFMLQFKGDPFEESTWIYDDLRGFALELPWSFHGVSWRFMHEDGDQGCLWMNNCPYTMPLWPRWDKNCWCWWSDFFCSWRGELGGLRCCQSQEFTWRLDTKPQIQRTNQEFVHLNWWAITVYRLFVHCWTNKCLKKCLKTMINK